MKKQNSNSLKAVSKLSGMFMKTGKCSAQRLSKVSESAVPNWRITLRRNRDRIRLPQRVTLQKIETCNAQRLSKVSEWERARKARKVESWESGNLETCYAQGLSKVSEWIMKTERRCAQRLSKVSESGAKRLDALEIFNIFFNNF